MNCFFVSLLSSFIHPLHCLNLLLDNLQLLNHSLHSSNRRIHQQRIASRQANLLHSLQFITKQLDSLQRVVLFDLQRQRRVPASSCQRLRTGPIPGCRFRPSQPNCRDEPRTSGTEYCSFHVRFLHFKPPILHLQGSRDDKLPR